MMRVLAPARSWRWRSAACGLRPLYGGGRAGAVAATLRSVEVAPIEGQVGWLVRNKLLDRLGATASGAAAYRLEVALDDDITAFGIRGDRAATRERRTLRARYQLVDLATGAVVLDATAGSDAGIDIVSSEYATVAAEQTALERLSDVVADQIVARLALFAARTAPRPQMKATKASIGAVGRPARPGHPLLSVPRPRRGPVAGARRAAGPGARRRPLHRHRQRHPLGPGAARRRSRGDEPVRRQARDLDRAGRRRDRRRGRGAARGAGAGKPGGRHRRRAAQDLGAAQARRSVAAQRSPTPPTRPRARTPSGWSSMSAARFGLKIGRRSRRGSRTPAATTRRSSAQELDKLALYVGASPEAPKELDHDALDAVGAEMRRGRFPAPRRPRAGGRHGRLCDELSRLSPGGAEAIPVVRSLQRRLLMLAPVRARIERGERSDAVMASMGKRCSGRTKQLGARLLATWDRRGLAKAAERAGRARALADVQRCRPPAEALGEELIAIARAARGADAPLRVARSARRDSRWQIMSSWSRLDVMQRTVPACALVRDLDLEPEHVAELPLERGEVGVDRLALRSAAARSAPCLARLRARFGLAHRQPLGDDLAGQPLRIGRGGDGARVAHADIASQ